MIYADAVALADSLNSRDQGVLIYSTLTIGSETIVLCVCARTGAVIGEL